MLEPLPARSVARFMLPLADVMTVLFSLFLLLPHLEQAGTGTGRLTPKAGSLGGIWSPDEQLQARDELARLRRLTSLPTSERLQVVVLAIDGKDGNLVLREGGSETVLRTAGDVGTMIQRHREAARTAQRELFYVLQAAPRLPGRLHPQLGDEARYREWFGTHKTPYQLSGL